MALAYLKRIDKLLYLCQQCAISGNVDGWTANLRGVFREASIRFTQEEMKDVDGDHEQKINIETLLDNNIQKSESNFKNIFFLLNNPKYKIKNKQTIMFLLDALEIKIRMLMQKRNMLLPSKADPTKAIMKM